MDYHNLTLLKPSMLLVKLWRHTKIIKIWVLLYEELIDKFYVKRDAKQIVPWSVICSVVFAASVCVNDETKTNNSLVCDSSCAVFCISLCEWRDKTNKSMECDNVLYCLRHKLVWMKTQINNSFGCDGILCWQESATDWAEEMQEQSARGPARQSDRLTGRQADTDWAQG